MFLTDADWEASHTNRTMEKIFLFADSAYSAAFTVENLFVFVVVNEDTDRAVVNSKHSFALHTLQRRKLLSIAGPALDLSDSMSVDFVGDLDI